MRVGAGLALIDWDRLGSVGIGWDRVGRRAGSALGVVSLAPPRPRTKADLDRCGLQRKRGNECQISPIVEPSLRFFVTLSDSPRRRPLRVDEAGLALIGFFAFSFAAPGPFFFCCCLSLRCLNFSFRVNDFSYSSFSFFFVFFLLVRSFSDEAASTGLAGSVVWACRTCCRGPLCAV